MNTEPTLLMKRIAKALKAYPDSDLVSLAETLVTIQERAALVFPAAEKLAQAVQNAHVGSDEMHPDCEVCKALKELEAILPIQRYAPPRLEPTSHAGDCTIYRALINGSVTDGICTCGYGWSLVRKIDWSQMYSKELMESEAKKQPSMGRELAEALRSALDRMAGYDVGVVYESARAVLDHYDEKQTTVA